MPDFFHVRGTDEEILVSIANLENKSIENIIKYMYIHLFYLGNQISHYLRIFFLLKESQTLSACLETSIIDKNYHTDGSFLHNQ